MHRLTAKFLLLFSLVGTFARLTLAVAAPAPACCVRKEAPTHHCHAAETPEPDQSTLTAFAGCSHDCCRGAVTSQLAHPQQMRSTLVLSAAVDHLIVAPTV